MFDLMKDRNVNEQTRRGYGMRKHLATFAMAVIVSCSAIFCSACMDPAENVIETQAATKEFSLKEVPKYSGNPSVAINGNKPYFTDREKKNTKAFESYHKLDKLGRCGVVYANVCPELMPTEERGAIGSVKPTGWHTVKYDSVEGRYLYNRCHLIGWQLAGENANERNLVTGTRYMNVDGMLKWEDDVARYIRETGNHVLYRSTPVFQDDELVCRGVLIEAQSIEDGGTGVRFAVWCYNAQPGIHIDYVTGDSSQMQALPAAGEAGSDAQPEASNSSGEVRAYVLNTRSKKFHDPDCPSVAKMSGKNRSDVEESRDVLMAQGFEPCGNCNP